MELVKLIQMLQRTSREFEFAYAWTQSMYANNRGETSGVDYRGIRFSVGSALYCQVSHRVI